MNIVIDLTELIIYANITLKRNIYTILKLLDEALVDVHGNTEQYHNIMINLLNYVAKSKELVFKEKEIDKIIDMYKKT